MNSFGFSNLATAGVLLLTLGSAPGTLHGQTPTQPAKPAPPAAVQGPYGLEQACQTLNISTEQFQELTRTTRQELQSELARLQDQIKEAEMSAPELAKLQSLASQLAGRQGELESSTEELTSHATELAALAQEKAEEFAGQESRVFVNSEDDGGGWLGVEIGEVTRDKARDLKPASARGVLVMDVEPDSPAAKAGLKEDDVVTQYDGQVVEGTVQFRRLVRETPAGRTVTLAISRNGSAQNISVELGDRGSFFEKKMKGKMRDFGNAYAFTEPNLDLHFDTPDMYNAFDLRTPVLGINAEDLSGQLGAYFGAPEGAGILVREVRSGSAAEKAGLQAGDVILKIDGKQVRSLGELREQLRDKSDQKSVSLAILRKGSELSVAVAIEKPQPPAGSTRTIHRAQL
jgi:C-terminal processing protease CtpA/Prc